MSDAAVAMVQEIFGEIGLVGMVRLVRSAVGSYDCAEDPHETLSTSQVEAIERLRPIACKAAVTSDDLDGIYAWDLLSIVTTAVELYDTRADAELASIIDLVRPFTCLDQDNDRAHDDTY